ncbi:MAG TPA: hypothetical protein VFY23_12870 [Candidatus Limnocylindrales bacterium]|nr:hypothetical protein [Candidatus Limnocylindrales bacterium]
MAPFLNMLTSRILPALLTALGVVLITAGLLTYPGPTTAGTAVVPTPEIVELPSEEPVSEEPSESPSPTPTLAPGVTPAPTPEPTAKPKGRETATRVVVPALDIDLPVIPGNDGYPYCNVAMYLTSSRKASEDVFGQPGEGRATYIYSHARDGMFGPIYELAIRDRTPNKMLGMVIQVYTSWNRVYLYEVRSVRLHITSLDKAMSRSKEEVWLQTSEGPKGTRGKTQVIGRFLSVEDATKKESRPKAKPVRC